MRSRRLLFVNLLTNVGGKCRNILQRENGNLTDTIKNIANRRLERYEFLVEIMITIDTVEVKTFVVD